MASYLLARLRRVGSGLFVSSSPDSAVVGSSTPPYEKDVTRVSAPQEEPVACSPSQDEAAHRPKSPRKKAVTRLPSVQKATTKITTGSASYKEESVAKSPSLHEESEDMFVSPKEGVPRSPFPQEAAVASGSPVPTNTTGLTQAEFEDSQRASKVRLPWDWRANGKTTEEYTPQIVGKWWSKTAKELSSAHPN